MAVVAVAVGLAMGAPGCGPGFQEVLVVGHDIRGTPVVGAVDCGLDDRLPAEVVSVSATSGSRTGREIWRVERPGRGLGPPEVGPPAPPEPQPLFIGGVPMAAIGDPLPPGGDAAVALAEPLPDAVVVEAYVFVDDLDPIAEVPLERSGRPDTYEVAFSDGSGEGGLDATEAAALVDDGCDDDWDFDGGVFALVLGIAGGVVLLLAIPVGIVTAHQFRRAGAAAAEAESRRRSGP